MTKQSQALCLDQPPFGGYKQSGIGRMHGEFGFHDMTQIKLVSAELS